MTSVTRSGPIKTLLLAALAALAWPIASIAQSPPAPSEAVVRVRAGVAALGRHWNAEVLAETARLYGTLQPPRASAGIRQIRDVSYGPHAQQKLDLFVPDQGFDALGPVFIFLHDGNATGGDKVLAGTHEQFYGNVAMAMARAGGIGINANYRPGGKWSAAEDVGLLVEWTRQNAAKYGGDPTAILAMGHGEGAVALAAYLFHQPSQPKDGPGIAGAILSSGTFGPPGGRPFKLIDSYQGKAVPILIWSPELDPLESGVADIKNKLCDKYGSCPMYVELAGHNHISAVMSFDSADLSAMGSIIRFYHSVVHK